MNKLSVAFLSISAVFVACSSHPDEEKDVGSASISITRVPTDVGCVKLTATGARTVQSSFDVAPGDSSVLLLSKLPVGAVSFRGDAYAGACSAVLPTTVAGWVADPVVATINTTGVTDVALVMRRNGRASVAVDFEDDDAGTVDAGSDSGSGACTSNAQCGPGRSCVNGACTIQAPNGSACSASSDCGSGFCVDGVCCSTACTESCMACNVTGSAGTCSPGASVNETCAPAGWTVMPPMPWPASGHIQAMLPDGSVFVFGGNASQAQALTFNGSAWKIGPTSVHGPRMRLVGGALPGGSILSAAGMVNGSVTATSEIYDFATNTFAATQPMVRATQWAAAATLPSGKVLVTGGSDQLANPMPSCQIFDPATRSWTMTASMTTPREHHAMAVLTDGKALVTGGVVGGSNALSTAEIFDPIIATWTQVPAMPFTASDHKMVALSDGRVMVVGSDMAALFDPISRTWQISNVFPTNLRGASVVKVGELIVVAGGQTSAAYIWDSRSQVWSSLRALSMPRSFMGASVSAGSFVLLTGGQDPGGNLLTLTEQSH